MKIPSVDLQAFINLNLNKDINELALQKNPFPEFDWKWTLNQIQAKKKANKKLPTWFKTDGIIFPSSLSIEQTSSEVLAQYKASLISGTSLIDLTGGFGIDDFYFSKTFQKVIHCEINEELSNIVSYNFKVLGINNISTISGDSVEYLENSTEKFDWVYVDPARRDSSKSKVFLLKDCIPNVVDLQEFLLSKSNHILIKVAPLLDIQSILNELNQVKKIYIIALNNEVKELLIEIEKNFDQKPTLVAVNHLNDETFSNHEFNLNDDDVASLSNPLTYLYEPFSSYLKTGLYNKLANQFQVKKLHKHSHLYTSEHLINFPGRVFKIEHTIPYNKKELKSFENQKWNITTRNFPLKVDEIRKKHKLKEGGEIYAFFTTNLNNEKIVILSNKL